MKIQTENFFGILISTRLLKSAFTDVIILNHGPILGYFQIGVLSKTLISIGPFVNTIKFAIKDNCKDSFVFLICFFFLFFHSLILSIGVESTLADHGSQIFIVINKAHDP